MSRSDHHRPRRTGAAQGFQLQRSDLVILSLLVSRRVGSSMVEQRPFKALVVGSSPTQPKIGFPTLPFPSAAAKEAIWQAIAAVQKGLST